MASGYGLVEGPTVDADGDLYFSDVIGGGVYRLDAAGGIETVVPKRRGVGGIALHADGGVVVSGRDIVHVRDGETRVVFRIDALPGWNDLCTDSAGRVYAGALRFMVFDGAAANRREWAFPPGAPDGMAVDESGCVWVASAVGGCVVRLTPDGAVDQQVDVPARTVTSVCFGGADRRDLYVVTADNTDDPERKGSILRIRVDAAGAPVHPARI